MRFSKESTPHPPTHSIRLLPLDALRGWLMVVMALDHANTFIAHGKRGFELWAGPFPNYHGDALAFITRLITHPAAPGFFFLMGSSMMLFNVSRRQQGWPVWKITRHFIMRGLLLILLQFLVENPAWKLGQPSDSTTYFGVLYALGTVTILGTLLLHLPTPWLTSLSALLILSTEFLLPQSSYETAAYAPLLRLWLIPGSSPGIFVLYPVMPWLGVVGLGMAYGRWLKRNAEGAYQAALWASMAASLFFIPLRLLGGFGNIRPSQGNNWIAFLNGVKYPPSVTFLLLTLGMDLLLLHLFAQVSESKETWLHPLIILGRVPLFFYVTHLYIYGLVGLWIVPHGTSIPGMYPFWILGLVILLPLCWVYGRFKQNLSPNSPWHLF